MRTTVLALGVAGVIGACGSSKPAKTTQRSQGPSRSAYVAGLKDVERQLGCGIVETIQKQGGSERKLSRFLRRLANAYAKASRRLKKLHPPADAVAPNANLAISLSSVADALRLGPVGLTDPTGRMTDQSIQNALLPPAADKALAQLRARKYPGQFDASNCSDTDLLSPSTKA